MEFEDRKKGFLERFSDHQGAHNFFITGIILFGYDDFLEVKKIMKTFSFALRPPGAHPNYIRYQR
jgi:hypothetical protein